MDLDRENAVRVNDHNSNANLITTDLTAAYEYLVTSATVEDVEWTGTSLSSAPPILLNQKFLAACQIDALLEELGGASIWTHGSYEAAIKLAVAQLERIHGSGKKEANKWSFGRSFLEDAKAHGFCHEVLKANMLLRSCAQTICGLLLPAAILMLHST